MGLELMLELPESAPEALLTALQPCMLDMAQAVCRTVTAASSVTSTRGSLLHVSAWLKAFAAYCTALPYELMQPVPTQQGVSLRDALLQVRSCGGGAGRGGEGNLQKCTIVVG